MYPVVFAGDVEKYLIMCDFGVAVDARVQKMCNSLPPPSYLGSIYGESIEFVYCSDQPIPPLHIARLASFSQDHGHNRSRLLVPRGYKNYL